MYLDYTKCFYVHYCKTYKEMWNTLKMIYGVYPSIELEEMNARGKEDGDTTFKCFSKFRNIEIYIGTFLNNQYLRIKIWKFNPILESKYGNLHEF